MLHIGDRAKNLDLDRKASAVTCYRFCRLLVCVVPVLLEHFPWSDIRRVVQEDEEGLLVEFVMRDLDLLP